jgi:hypothetical protein
MGFSPFIFRSCWYGTKHFPSLIASKRGDKNIFFGQATFFTLILIDARYEHDPTPPV